MAPGAVLCLPGRAASPLDTYLWSRPSEERSMREFGVRRYGDTLYHHCMADSAADAANWFAHFQTGIEGKDFQALVKDVARPVSDEAGIGGETEGGGGFGPPSYAGAPRGGGINSPTI